MNVEEEAQYPYVICDEEKHGRQLGYGVCKHVLKGEKAEVWDDATEKELGWIACRKCASLVGPNGTKLNDTLALLNNYKLVCARHVKELIPNENRNRS